jgi:hypothetical protein
MPQTRQETIYIYRCILKDLYTISINKRYQNLPSLSTSGKSLKLSASHPKIYIDNKPTAKSKHQTNPIEDTADSFPAGILLQE